MITKRLFNLFCILIIIFFVACTSKIRSPRVSKQVLANPYTLEVIDELYDGDTLFLQVELTQLASLPDKLTLISLAGFNDRQEKDEIFFNLLDLQIDSQGQFTLALPVKNLVEYQIQLFWGKQAWSFYEKIYPQLASNLDILHGEVEKLRECQDDSCQIKFRINFDLKNNNQLTIPKISLNLSLLENLEENGLITPHQLYTKNISINDFNLAGGKLRRLEYIIVQPAELSELNTVAEVSIAKKF